MGLPAQGIESVYRNPIDEVARFLNNRHGSNYMIFNLSERKYNYDMFEGRVIEAGWPDHHTAPLNWIVDIAKAIDGWLASSSDHVAVVHCLAGKGRTGVAVASYLLYSGSVLSPDWSAQQYDDAEELDAPALIQRVYDAADEGDGEADEGDEDEDSGAKGVEHDESPKSLPDQTSQPEASHASLHTRDRTIELRAGQSVHGQFPSAAELGARAILAFVKTRGDGLNFASQRRSIRYLAELCRGAVVTSLTQAAQELRMALSAMGSSTGASTVSGEGEGEAASPMPPLKLDFNVALNSLADLASPPAPTVLLYTVVFHGIPGARPDDTLANGCTPSIQLRSLPYQGSDEGEGQAVFDSAWSAPDGILPSYTRDDSAIVIPMNATIKGDVLLRCLHHRSGSGKKPKELFRYTFHTGFMELGQNSGDKIHRVFAAELDMDRRKKNARRLPPGFHMDLLYEYAGKQGAPAGETAGAGHGEVGDGTVAVHENRLPRSPGSADAAYSPLGASGVFGVSTPDQTEAQDEGQGKGGQATGDGPIATDSTVATENEVKIAIDQIQQGGASV